MIAPDRVWKHNCAQDYCSMKYFGNTKKHAQENKNEAGIKSFGKRKRV